MKKKNLLNIILAVTLVTVLTVGGTLAYFTSLDTADNTFTMGRVGIDLQEKYREDDDWGDGPLSFENVVPGDTADKMVRVSVDGDSEDCFIRVVATIFNMDEEGPQLTDEQLTSIAGLVKTAIGTEWTVAQVDNELTCTLKASATAGETPVLFSEIYFPLDELGNDYAGTSFTIELSAYAVQADNVTLATFDWDGIDWVTGNAIAVLP